MIYYVSQKNKAPGTGTKNDPFRTIGQAARIAMPGDTVLIGGGIYREWVDPKNGGLGNNQRITYLAAKGERPVISGAEIIDGWKREKENVWSASVDNALFAGRNPYEEELYGDWYDGLGQTHHAGELFLDGEAMYESPSLEALLDHAGDAGRLSWFAQVTGEQTIFYGNFCGKDPNAALTEISARPFCFFPSRTGRDYITVSGFEIRQAAVQWAPPTAFQPGLIGPNWSKGWIIENCRIHDSKCSGISLGKKEDLKDNAWTKNPIKNGTQTYTEMIFSNLRDGWNKEHVGSHTVRDNEIYNCGQAGIIGCMGGAFSRIVHNHIHHINVRQEISGAEIAGIKLHAAIDVMIERNFIHDCTRGLWLDWQAQGAAVRRNAFYANRTEDLFVEVCHGPCLVENNIMLSDRSFLNVSQGTACVHNLFAGTLYALPDTNRFTLYHLPHSTAVGGVMLVYGGDDRILNNIFSGTDGPRAEHETCGTSCYDGYGSVLSQSETLANSAQFDTVYTFPVQIRDNAYVNGALPSSPEENPRTASGFAAEFSISWEDGQCWLNTNLYDAPLDLLASPVSTETLGKAFESDQAFENPDGSPLQINTDFYGNKRGNAVKIGPLETPSPRIRLW